MSSPSGEIKHVSDTALMVAGCRALETARSDGFVHDPFAERLAGERGMAIVRSIPRPEMMCFGIGVRSRFMDELITNCITGNSITTVLSIGCGLDSRPWRLDLPANLRWIEIDFPDMLEYKTGVMASEKPRCRLEHLPADLTGAAQRRQVFERAPAAPGLMITEGLLMYLASDIVEALAAEPAAVSGIRYWLSDITSPGFARNIGMDSYQSIQDMRAAGHLDGLQILDVVYRNGWASVDRRSYLTGDIAFAADRIRRMMNIPPGTPLPAPTLPLDDPTGVHLFGRV